MKTNAQQCNINHAGKSLIIISNLVCRHALYANVASNWSKKFDTSHLAKVMKLLRPLFLLILFSCSSNMEPMNEWEIQMADKLKAERVELFHRSSTTKTDGRLTASENYLLFDVYNSKVLTEIKHNDRILNEKCQELADYILSLPSLSELPKFNEFRIDINETHGFSIFKTKTTKTISYKINK